MVNSTCGSTTMKGQYIMDKIYHCPGDKTVLIKSQDKIIRVGDRASNIYRCPFCSLRYVDFPELFEQKRFFSGNDGYINLSAKTSSGNRNRFFEELPNPVRLPSDDKKGKKENKKNKKGNLDVKKKNKKSLHKGNRMNIHQLMQSSIPSRASTKSYVHDTDGMHL